jgi:pyruvate dehydrogenase E1 component alpha subunit
VLDEEGNADASLEPTLSQEELVRRYVIMSTTRAFDRKAVSLQRQGRSFTYTPFEGQEAIQVTAARLLDPKDWAFPSYRESAFYLARGAPMSMLFTYLKGHEDGMAIPDKTNDFPLSIPVGSQIAHAPGAAYANKLLKNGKIAIAFFGDGASSQGDFHEALNFSGIYKLPVVFICTNNQYAISTPRMMQTASETIAQRAMGYGIHGVQADGMDPLAMEHVLSEAFDRARKGEGPTLVEAIAYRFGPHSTADDPKKYREDAEADPWRKLDWAVRYRKYLERKGLWNNDVQAKLDAAIVTEVEAAVAKAEEFKDSPSQMFDFVYPQMTAELQRQKAEFSEVYGL